MSTQFYHIVSYSRLVKEGANPHMAQGFSQVKMNSKTVIITVTQMKFLGDNILVRSAC